MLNNCRELNEKKFQIILMAQKSISKKNNTFNGQNLKYIYGLLNSSMLSFSLYI